MFPIFKSDDLMWMLHFLHHWTEYCEKYAKPEDMGAVPEEKSSDEELSEDDSSGDEEVAGHADP